jgi:hypothetical protein
MQRVVTIRHDWTRLEVEALYHCPFNDLLFEAQAVHRQHFDPNRVQISTLLSVKTGACPEDCKYCPQSVHYNTGLERERLLPVDDVVAAAEAARANGATRFCMGAAWRNPTDRNLERIIEMIAAVRELGMETCVTLGMLRPEQAERLKAAGLDYYNHNLDSSPEYYEKVVTTRSYEDRLQTLGHVRAAGIKVCLLRGPLPVSCPCGHDTVHPWALLCGHPWPHTTPAQPAPSPSGPPARSRRRPPRARARGLQAPRPAPPAGHASVRPAPAGSPLRRRGGRFLHRCHWTRR